MERITTRPPTWGRPRRSAGEPKARAPRAPSSWRVCRSPRPHLRLAAGRATRPILRDLTRRAAGARGRGAAGLMTDRVFAARSRAESLRDRTWDGCDAGAPAPRISRWFAMGDPQAPIAKVL